MDLFDLYTGKVLDPLNYVNLYLMDTFCPRIYLRPTDRDCNSGRIRFDITQLKSK